MKKDQKIETLRAISCILVVCYHYFPNVLPGGFIGVDVFFVISGYLIAKQINQNFYSDFKTQYKSFLKRRFVRIFPALMTVTAVSVILCWFALPPSDLIDFASSILASTFFVSNIFFWQEIGYFDTHSKLKPFLHTWSLGVEFQFYITIPIVLFLCKTIFGRRGFSYALWFLMLGSFVICATQTPIRPGASFYLLPTRYWEFMLGAIVAVHHDHLLKNFQIFLSQPILTISSLLLLVCGCVFLDGETAFPGVAALIPTLSAGAIILATPTGKLIKLFASRPLVYLGSISFPLYLWHVPLYVISFFYFGLAETSFNKIVLVVLCVSLSAATKHFVEDRFHRKEVMFLVSKKLIVVLCLFTCILFYQFAIISSGFLNRFDEKTANKLSVFVGAKRFVVEFFNKRSDVEYYDNSKFNILILGDSFAQDMSNVLNVNLHKYNNLNVVTHYIPSSCGGQLYPSHPLEHNHDCYEYYKSEFLEKIRNSDQIWLAWRWDQKSIGHLTNSMNFLDESFYNKLKVFGPKYFGEVNSITYFHEVKKDADYLGVHHLPKKLKEQDEELSRLFGDDYISLLEKNCGINNLCNNYDAEGIPLSYDGGHLTSAGARFFSGLVESQVSDHSH